MCMLARDKRQHTWAPRCPWSRRANALCSVMLLLCATTGCAVGPNFVRPNSPPVTHYSRGTDPTETPVADGAAQHFSLGTKVSADWWRLFKSAQLDAVMAEAIANNPGLEAAQASLRGSEDNLRSGYGIFYPQINADAAATRQRYSPLKVGENVPGSVFNLFTLSATVSYALDVFGGQRRMIEGLGAERDVARATAQATFLTLSANIVNTVIAKAAYQAEIEATQQLIELQGEQVKLAEVQAQAGTVAYSTVLSLRSQLASYEAAIPQLEQKLVQSDDLLAALAGRVPSEWSAPEVGLADLVLPSDLPVSLPSELVRQRPDILASEATAHAASANIGVATAALLPNITLSGSVGTNSTSMHGLFGPNARFWSLGANATAPVFEGGTLWFRRKAAIDTYQQAMALYRQTVLYAFAQVADTLRALDHDAAALRADAEGLATAEQALHLVQVNYEAGLATYLDVLNADAQSHQARIADVQAIAVRHQDTVALFAALGGGWWSRADPLDTAHAPHDSASSRRALYDASAVASPGISNDNDSQHE
jgi:NodT family efflux transporter outer membrane factor (OMF) lipoprotein